MTYPQEMAKGITRANRAARDDKEKQKAALMLTKNARS